MKSTRGWEKPTQLKFQGSTMASTTASSTFNTISNRNKRSCDASDDEHVPQRARVDSGEAEDRQDEEINIGVARRLCTTERDLRKQMFELLSSERAQEDHVFSFLNAFYDFVEHSDGESRVYQIEEEGGRMGYIEMELGENNALRITAAGLLPLAESTINVSALLEAVDEMFASSADCFTCVASVYINSTVFANFRATEDGCYINSRARRNADVQRMIGVLDRRGYFFEHEGGKLMHGELPKDLEQFTSAFKPRAAADYPDGASSGEEDEEEDEEEEAEEPAKEEPVLIHEPSYREVWDRECAAQLLTGKMIVDYTPPVVAGSLYSAVHHFVTNCARLKSCKPLAYEVQAPARNEYDACSGCVLVSFEGEHGGDGPLHVVLERLHLFPHGDHILRRVLAECATALHSAALPRVNTISFGVSGSLTAKADGCYSVRDMEDACSAAGFQRNYSLKEAREARRGTESQYWTLIKAVEQA